MSDFSSVDWGWSASEEVRKLAKRVEVLERVVLRAKVAAYSASDPVIAAAVAAERERCVQVAVSHAGYRGGGGAGYDFNFGYQRAATEIAVAIRKVEGE